MAPKRKRVGDGVDEKRPPPKARPRVTLHAAKTQTRSIMIGDKPCAVTYYAAMKKPLSNGVTFVVPSKAPAVASASASSSSAAEAAAAGDVILAKSDGTPLLRVHSHAVSGEQAAAWLKALRDPKHSHWARHASATMKTVQQPRYITSWTVDAKSKPPYKYSGTFTVPTVDVTESAVVQEVLALIKTRGGDADYVLGNLYEPASTPKPLSDSKSKPDLDDSVDEHADIESRIDQTQSIWSLSLGDTRRFTIYAPKELASSNATKTARVLMTIDMPHGLMLEMCPGMQACTTHAVHKRTAEERKLHPVTHQLRINLTARKLKQ